MKALWEEYGGVIIAIIVIAALITLAGILSTQTSGNITGSATQFESIGSNALDDTIEETITTDDAIEETTTTKE